MRDQQYIDIRNSLDAFRHINESIGNKKNKNLITESDDKDTSKSDSVPYTNQDELMNSIMETTKKQFGADYNKFKTPMLYWKEDGDITLSGEISMLNNAKFQFRYKDDSGCGCYIWTEPLRLTKDNLKTLQIIFGVYENWKKELSSSEDIKPMALKDDEIAEIANQSH